MLFDVLAFAPIGLVACFFAMRFWRAAIIGVLIWAMIEGAIRKWILPQYQSQILLVKDFVLVFTYIGYLMSPSQALSLNNKSKTLATLLLAEAIYCTLQVFNPNSPSTLLSIFGLKNYLIYLPLAFIIPDMIVDREQLRKWLFRTCFLAIPIALLGLYQFSQPPASWVNQYVSHEEGVEAVVSVFGEQSSDDEFRYGRARTSSTFSYIGGFTTFLLLSVPLAASLLLSGVPKRRLMLIVTATLVLSIAAAATTGSRTPMFVFAVALPILILIAGWKKLLPIEIAIRIAGGIAIAGLGTVAVFGSAFSALEYRAANSDSTVDRLLTPITETVAAYQTSPMIGTGIGTNSNAASKLLGGDLLWWLDGIGYELESARVMQEMGVIGFLVVYLPKLFIIFLVFSHLRHSRSPLMIATHMATLIYVLVHFVLFTVNNPTGGLMYWSLIGVSIAARRIEDFERHALSYDQYYEVETYWPDNAVRA